MFLSGNGNLTSFLICFQSLKTKRLAKFSEVKLAILQLLEQLEGEPNTTFERNVVCEADEAFVLSASNLDAVEEYLHTLEKQVEVRKLSFTQQ